MAFYTVSSKPSGCAACHLNRSCLPPRTNASEAFGDLHPHLESVTAAKGCFVYRAGEQRRAYFLLRSGSAKAIVSDEYGRHCVTTFYLPTDLIGVSSVGRRTYVDSLELLERSTVCELPAASFESQCAADHALMHGMFSKLSSACSLDRNARLRISRVAATARLADFLLELGSRMELLHRSPSKLLLSMSRHDIASHLSMATETVSRAFHRLEADGLIAVHGRQVEIVCIEALSLCASESNANPTPSRRDPAPALARGATW